MDSPTPCWVTNEVVEERILGAFLSLRDLLFFSFFLLVVVVFPPLTLSLFFLPLSLFFPLNSERAFTVAWTPSLHLFRSLTTQTRSTIIYNRQTFINLTYFFFHLCVWQWRKVLERKSCPKKV